MDYLTEKKFYFQTYYLCHIERLFGDTALSVLKHLQIILYPYKMINKFKKLFFLVKNLKEKKENYLDYQLDMFKKNGLDRQLGLKIFNEYAKKHFKKS